MRRSDPDEAGQGAPSCESKLIVPENRVGTWPLRVRVGLARADRPTLPRRDTVRRHEAKTRVPPCRKRLGCGSGQAGGGFVIGVLRSLRRVLIDRSGPLAIDVCLKLVEVVQWNGTCGSKGSRGPGPKVDRSARREGITDGHLPL